jgi:cytochrome b6-f complex iron-sulfur subunit
MSDDSTNKPPGAEDKPKKQPRIWPGRAATSAPGEAQAAPPVAPAAEPVTAVPAEPQGEAPAGEKPKKEPRIWKGRAGGAAPAAGATAAPAAPVATAARTAAAAPSAPAKTMATAKPPVPLVPVPKKPEVIESEQRLKQRRRFAISFVFTFLTANLLMFMRFFFPRVLYEPKTVFKIGYPSDFGFGVETKYQKDYRIWVVRNSEGIFAIYARCTHLGCTPDWISSENKFKCPCHGSGYDSEGINFEGPAPRPMDRAKVELDPQGQIVVDTSKLYQWPKGARSEFKDPGAFLPV